MTKPIICYDCREVIHGEFVTSKEADSDEEDAAILYWCMKCENEIMEQYYQDLYFIH